jgi:hypothetical protein
LGEFPSKKTQFGLGLEKTWFSRGENLLKAIISLSWLQIKQSIYVNFLRAWQEKCNGAFNSSIWRIQNTRSASFCWASISKSCFLNLNTKLYDSYMFFDPFNDMNTMVESFMPFNKVSKLA